MNISLLRGFSALAAFQSAVDVAADNLANAETPGYVKGRSAFCELVQQDMTSRGVPAGSGAESRTLGTGVALAAVSRQPAAGQSVETGRELDLAVLGEGFFKVVLPGGEERYTRSGCFSQDGRGALVTAGGARLDGVEIPPQVTKVKVAADGRVTCEAGGEVREAGQVMLYKFSSAGGLVALGDNLYAPADGTDVIEGVPGEDGFGTISQGKLEMPEINTVDGFLELIEWQRLFSLNARAVKAAYEMWGTANNLRK